MTLRSCGGSSLLIRKLVENSGLGGLFAIFFNLNLRRVKIKYYLLDTLSVNNCNDLMDFGGQNHVFYSSKEIKIALVKSLKNPPTP